MAIKQSELISTVQSDLAVLQGKKENLKKMPQSRKMPFC